MKTVADVLNVSRSNLAERLRGRSKVRGPYRKTEDADLLPTIRRHRRCPAHLWPSADRRAPQPREASRRSAGRQRQRVHRIMGNNAMLLEKHTAVRKGRLHDGKVKVVCSNLRWCSDGLEFTCWNGDIVRFVFIIDAFDREIIAWTAVANAGISGSDVRD